MIKPFLDHITLPALGDLNCLHHADNWRHALNADTPEVTGDKGHSLKTQGVFRTQWWENIKYKPYEKGDPLARSGTVLVWGISRSGKWVLATVRFIGSDKRHSRGWEEAKTVVIEKVALAQLLARTKEPPERIWKELGDVVKGWAAYHKSLFEDTLQLAQTFEMEEAALSCVHGS